MFFCFLSFFIRHKREGLVKEKRHVYMGSRQDITNCWDLECSGLHLDMFCRVSVVFWTCSVMVVVTLNEHNFEISKNCVTTKCSGY